MDEAKRQAITEKTKTALGGFTTTFTKSYTNLKLASMIEDDEEEESTWKLLERPEGEEGEEEEEEGPPIRTGLITKRGAVRKNWKERFFVVRSNYLVDYYDNQQTFENDGRPKGSISLAGYEVVRDPNAKKMEIKQERNRKLGLSTDVEPYTKYEHLTLECYHPSKRRWLFQFSAQEDFDSWAETFDECCRKAPARSMKEKEAAEAFDTAFEKSKEDMGYQLVNYGGSEDEMLSALIFDFIKDSELESVYSTLPGPDMAKATAYDKVNGVVHGIISSIITPALKALVAGLGKLVDKLKSTVTPILDTVKGAKAKTIEGVQGKVMDVVNPVKDKILAPLCNLVIKVVKGRLVKSFVSIDGVFDEHINKFQESYTTKEQLEAGFGELGTVSASVSNKYADGLKSLKSTTTEVSESLPADLSSNVPDPSNWPITQWLDEVSDSMKKITDNAFYTFETELKEAVGDDQDEAAIKSAAASVAESTKGRLREDIGTGCVLAITSILDKVVGDTLRDKVGGQCGDLVAPIDEQIPEAAQEYITANGCLEEVLEGVVSELNEDLATKAIGDIEFQ